MIKCQKCNGEGKYQEQGKYSKYWLICNECWGKGEING